MVQNYRTKVARIPRLHTNVNVNEHTILNCSQYIYTRVYSTQYYSLLSDCLDGKWFSSLVNLYADPGTASSGEVLPWYAL